MDLADYHKQIGILKDEKRKIISKVIFLKEKYVGELPFKVGDKVEIEGYGIGFLGKVRVNDFGSLQVIFYIPKKNGEKSKKYQYAWGLKLEGIKLL